MFASRLCVTVSARASAASRRISLRITDSPRRVSSIGCDPFFNDSNLEPPLPFAPTLDPVILSERVGRPGSGRPKRVEGSAFHELFLRCCLTFITRGSRAGNKLYIECSVNAASNVVFTLCLRVFGFFWSTIASRISPFSQAICYNPTPIHGLRSPDNLC